MAITLSEESARILAMSRKQYLMQAAGQHFDKVVVGAAIFTANPVENGGPRILLLKRSATEQYYPNIFELPGGKVDDTDETIHDAVSREVMEETGLQLTNMLASLPAITYSTTKVSRTEDGHVKLIEKAAIQLSFVAEVCEKKFRVNPAEHSEGLWTSKKALEELNMTAEMRELVLRAFYVAGNHFEK